MLMISVETDLWKHWITFYDGEVKTFSGRPPKEGTYDIVVRATDPYGLFVDAILRIIVLPNAEP